MYARSPIASPPPTQLVARPVPAADPLSAACAVAPGEPTRPPSHQMLYRLSVDEPVPTCRRSRDRRSCKPMVRPGLVDLMTIKSWHHLDDVSANELAQRIGGFQANRPSR